MQEVVGFIKDGDTGTDNSYVKGVFRNKCKE